MSTNVSIDLPDDYKYRLYDPVTEFCSLYLHSTAVVVEQLYIVQGYAQYIRDGKRKGAGNPHLRYMNINQRIPVARSGEFITVVTNKTHYPENVPQTVSPALWFQANTLYLYMAMGGTVNFQGLILQDEDLYNPGSPKEIWRGSTNFDDTTVFAPNANTFNRWNAEISGLEDPTGMVVSRNTYWDDSLRKGYIVGGWVDAITNPTDSFLIWDYDTNVWTNSSLPWGRSSGNGIMGSFRINDRLVHIHVGGEVNGVYIPMNTARIYDSETQDWYTQEIFGEPPIPRGDACTAIVAAPDKSSYQMYMFGGAESGSKTARYLSELWVLNIPSFTWVLLDNSVGDFAPGARSASSCNILRNHILMVYAGKKSITAGQAADCETNGNAAYFMDLNTLKWLETYEGNKTKLEYCVPSPVYEVIGGNKDGGAKIIAPPDGFNSEILATLFSINGTRVVNPNPPAEPSSTESIARSNNNTETTSVPTGAIVGGAVGAILLVTLAVLAFIFVRRRNKNSKIMAHNDIPVGGRTELPVDSEGGSYDQNLTAFKDPRAEYSGFYQSTVLGAPTTQGVYIYELPTAYGYSNTGVNAQEPMPPQDHGAENPTSTLSPDHELPLPPTPPGVPAPEYRNQP
ncbi:hypothetical protein TWF106_011233 [Orbilia oligospora]|uniref:Kelch repeat protein n=2 Tax=Orbilia oligospora TaxID=2813651 RepID=A0A7C8UXI2_ORBOL|nr:hypothetical protein TWF106_011233 [Orbilia oligospora]